MYRKILVPLDGSKLSEASLPHLRNLAMGTGAGRVMLFRAREPIDEGVRQRLSQDLACKLDQTYQDEAEEYLKNIANSLSAEGIDVATEVVVGNAAESILRYAGQNDIELIVMSSHGRTGIARLAFGSVAENVLRQSPAPVLIIPQHRV